MPSLEKLKKQAKLVLRWHRDRYYPVAAQIRVLLPRYRHLTDPGGLAHSFRLSDAQELVARQNGFDSWPALKEGLSTMSDPASASSSRAVITAIAPELFVADIKASCDSFTQKLGSSIVFIYGEPPFYGLWPGQSQMRGPSGHRSSIRDRECLLSADMGVDMAEAIKQLFLDLQSAGVVFHQTLRREPWGAKTFIVKDPDGNLLLFAGPAE
jgi:catechol 2,3-dioxygenase-like lactoylglutathione lyase family enzyme